MQVPASSCVADHGPAADGASPGRGYTADEIPDPGYLRIRCPVNGEILQDANTSEKVHDVPALIAFCSRFVTLQPGDLIATGTPGVGGAFRQPPRFLGDGDEVAVEIDGIGRLTNTCRVIGG